MNNYIIVSDFDGTITKEDTLYGFFRTYAQSGWKQVEQDWKNNIITSKECLIKEFSLVPNLSKELIDTFTKTVELNDGFVDFLDYAKKNQIDFIIVSDGIDYFINSVLNNHGINGVEVVTNHGEFINGKFVVSFPNDNKKCIKDAGTCKCSIVADLRNKYDEIIYVGDGVSDYCVADKVDVLFATSNLLSYCKENDIGCLEYKNYRGVIEYDRIRRNDFRREGSRTR